MTRNTVGAGWPTPAIPVGLADRPTLAGLVVPWITPRTPDGRWLFGSIDHDRHRHALTGRLCQICGRRLGARIVFAVRDLDLQTLTSAEPGMHPVCAAYTATACPMLAGRMTHHHATPLSDRLPGLDMRTYGDPAGSRPGAPAPAWNLLWANGYRPYTHPVTGMLAALVLPDQILRIRPIHPTGRASST